MVMDGNQRARGNVEVVMRSMSIVPALVVLLAACGASTRTSPNAATTAATAIATTAAIATLSGRVTGTVLAGPTCPVEQIHSVGCAPKAVAGIVRLTEQGHTVVSVRLDHAGAFIVVAPIGTYVLMVDIGANMFPRCPSRPLTVADGAVTTAAVVCDTGIR
jgi:hypothetical protein